MIGIYLHQLLAKSYTRQVFDKDGTGRMSINKLVEVMSMSGQFCTIQMSTCSILDVDAAGNSFTDSELEETCHLFALPLQICLFLLCVTTGWTAWEDLLLNSGVDGRLSLNLVPMPSSSPFTAEVVPLITVPWCRTTSLGMEVLLPWATGQRCKVLSQKTHCRRFQDFAMLS